MPLFFYFCLVPVQLILKLKQINFIRSRTSLTVFQPSAIYTLESNVLLTRVLRHIIIKIISLPFCWPRLMLTIKFVIISVCSFGKERNSGIFFKTVMGRQILSCTFPFRDFRELPGTDIKVSRVTLEDQDFRLHNIY